MIGVVVFTHGDLAKELVRAVEMILGPQERLVAIGLAAGEDVEAVKERLEKSIAATDAGDGVVVLTDLFGGTPSNLALSLHREGKIEVLMGLNLAMLLKLASSRAGTEDDGKVTLAELASQIAEYGRKNIQAATDILKKKTT